MALTYALNARFYQKPMSKKYCYIVFDLFGTVTKYRYLQSIFYWFASGKRSSANLIDKRFVPQIKRLSGKYQLCILSNANHQFVYNSLKKSGLTRYFRVILISSDIGARKPSSEAFEALIWAGVEPAKSLFIDDRESNRRKAKMLGYSVLEFSDKSDLLQKISDL